MAEPTLSNDAVYSAAPTVRINGQEYPIVTEQMLSVEVKEHEGGMSALEMRVSNVASHDDNSADLAFEDDQILKLGAQIAVYGGDRNKPQEIFRGSITALEADFPESAAPELVVLAEDVFQQARMARRTKVWENSSIAAVAKAIAGQLNLTPVVTGLTTTYPVLVQFNESDLAFLRRLLARADADLQVVASEMHVAARKDTDRGSLDLELHGELRAARVLADLAHQVTEVTVTGWDIKQGNRISSTSTGSYLLPGTGKKGSAVLQDALGKRSEHVGDPAVASQSEAQALADAIFDQRSRPFVCIEGTAEGNPALRVGTQVNLTGLGGRFSNSYFVTRCRHKYDLDHGYSTDFEAECAFLGERLIMRNGYYPYGLQEHAGAEELARPLLGKVVSVQDPEKLSRVQVRLYSFDGVADQDAAIWARVALPFAGDNRGVFMLPDVGDEVLVVFANGDSRFPVVVGGLWNGATGIPETLDGDRVDRWSITGKAGTRIAIEEKKSGKPTIVFTTPGGVTGKLTDDAGGSIELSLPGGTTTIKLDTSGVTVQTGSTVQMQASQVNITAGQVSVKAGMATFSGVVQCDTLIATTVSAKTYVPGAGNVW